MSIRRYVPGALLNLRMGGAFHINPPPVRIMPHTQHWSDPGVPHGGASEPSSLHYLFGGSN